ncbi:uncharacterized protein [Nicotiana tomentosiformis]|uniref:uncharacterized protein n=1 Tax=Nicotiana tomentosiformis TaxID=4098 RepID=UPI00388C3CA2
MGNIEEVIKKIMVDNQNQPTAIRNLEQQMGQLAKKVLSKNRKQVTFSEKQLTTDVESKTAKEVENPIEEAVAMQPQPIIAKPPRPFPQRLQKVKDNVAYKKFLDILKQVQISIPLVDILQEVPKYAKYIKEIVANKRKLIVFETVALTEECSSRIQNKLPPKLKDPGSFTIQISIGKHVVGRALCDLGASINLMPLFVFQQLGLGDLRPTMVVLQLVDRSLASPEGVIEDVLVQVGTFIFPADFIILDYEPDQEVPFILGRPFLATGHAIIDVYEGQMTMRVGDNVETDIEELQTIDFSVTDGTIAEEPGLVVVTVTGVGNAATEVPPIWGGELIEEVDAFGVTFHFVFVCRLGAVSVPKVEAEVSRSNLEKRNWCSTE